MNSQQWFVLIILMCMVIALLIALLVATLRKNSKSTSGSGKKQFKVEPKQKSRNENSGKIEVVGTTTTVYDTALAHKQPYERLHLIRTQESEVPNVDAVIVISGKQHKKRLEETIAELNKWPSMGNVYHLDAVWRPNGAEGCMQSHIAALTIAAKWGKNVLIVEDDFTAAVSKEEFVANMNEFYGFTEKTDKWDMLIMSQFVHDWARVNGAKYLMRIYKTTTTGAYLIQKDYAKILRDLWMNCHDKVRASETWEVGATEIDQSWEELSQKDKWFGFIKSLGQQRPQITTIGGTYADNTWTSSKDLTKFYYKGGGEEAQEFPLTLREPVTF